MGGWRGRGEESAQGVQPAAELGWKLREGRRETQAQPRGEEEKAVTALSADIEEEQKAMAARLCSSTCDRARVGKAAPRMRRNFHF